MTENDTCAAAGCGARIHGNGLCRVHFDQLRYQETTAQDPEAAAAASREHRIDSELRLGHAPQFASPHGSMFANPEERRQAWEERREELLAEYPTPPMCPGHRPAAWWEFEAGREQYASESADIGEVGLLEWTRLDDEREVESLCFLAAGGHLTGDERAALHEAANEAGLRIETDAERGCLHTADDGSHIWTGPDRLAVKVWGAVEAALSTAGAQRAKRPA